jgi:twitching motility protein PilU
MNLAMNLKAILSQRLVKTIDGKRIAAIEILINTPRIADLILKGKVESIKETMEAGGQYGMVTFDQALLQLWQYKKISDIESLRNADSANNLRLAMKMASLEGSADDSKADSIDQLLQNGKSDNDPDDGFELSI